MLFLLSLRTCISNLILLHCKKDRGRPVEAYLQCSNGNSPWSSMSSLTAAPHCSPIYANILAGLGTWHDGTFERASDNLRTFSHQSLPLGKISFLSAVLAVTWNADQQLNIPSQHADRSRPVDAYPLCSNGNSPWSSTLSLTAAPHCSSCVPRHLA